MKKNKTVYRQFMFVLLCYLMSFNSLVYAKSYMAPLSNKVSIIKCNPKAASSFAIFIDNKSFNECREEVLAYKYQLEQEGLATSILHAEWDNPNMVKHEIASLAAKKPQLEGMVFIGDIPIVRVRKGQHLTTAFKMNETTFPMNESSVPSDRFYDCPSLVFNYVGQDSINTNWFYYNLSHEGEQSLSPDYYSARMVVPQTLVQATGIDKYTLLKRYLIKVVKVHKEQNVLDKFIYFAGSGYNSDCLTAWRQQAIAFKSYFPAAFKDVSGNRFLNFRQDPQMKFTLFNEMQRGQIDVFLFYEHGSPEKQYIGGDYPSENLGDHVNMLKNYIRSGYKRAKKEKKGEFLKEACAYYGFPAEMFSQKEMDLFWVEDSTRLANRDINLKDLATLKTGARFTMLNACYNGSFHQPGYVAGYHLFNDGNTVVTQGNTVNVLQDKWADQLIGMLSLGIRIGFWQKEVITLESHLIGDPTFCFNVEKPNSWNSDLLFSTDNEAYWREQLQVRQGIVRALAIKQLQKCYLVGGLKDSRSFSKNMLDIFNTDANLIVRMQALNALAICADENLTAAVLKGLYDPYEMIRRQSAHLAGKIGDPSFVKELKNVIKNYPEAIRVTYAAQSALQCFSTKKQINTSDAGVQNDIRKLRNYPSHFQVDHLLTILNDQSVGTDIRLLLCEALGWYSYSIHREKLISALEVSLQNDTHPLELRAEMTKTLKRLKYI